MLCIAPNYLVSQCVKHIERSATSEWIIMRPVVHTEIARPRWQYPAIDRVKSKRGKTQINQTNERSNLKVKCN